MMDFFRNFSGIPLSYQIRTPGFEAQIRRDVQEVSTSSLRFQQLAAPGQLIDGIRNIVIVDRPSAIYGFNPFVQLAAGAVSFDSLSGNAYVFINPNRSSITATGTADTIAGTFIHEIFHLKKDSYYLNTLQERHSVLLINENDVRSSFGMEPISIESFNSSLATKPNSFVSTNDPVRCFPANTQIALPDGTSTPISAIDIGDIVLSFDPYAEGGRGALTTGVVTQLYSNVTQEWLAVTLPSPPGGPSRRPLIATPGHETLRPEGGFARLVDMVQWHSGHGAQHNAAGQHTTGTVTLVDRDGSLITGSVERLVYSAATAHLFEQAVMMTGGGSQGSLKLAA